MASRGPVSQKKPTLVFEAGVPAAPDWLDDDAKAEFARVVAIIAEVPGHLQQVDFSTLNTYSQAFSDVKRLTVEVRGKEMVQGSKGPYLNPLCNALAQSHNRMREAAARLGFSPADRARVNGAGKLTKAGVANPTDKFF